MRTSRYLALATALMASTTAVSEAAAQLVAEAEALEACAILRLGAGFNVPERLAFTRTPGLKLDPAGDVLRDAVEAGLLLPEYFAPIRSFFVTHGGQVWLQESVTPEGYDAQWIVVGHEGEPEFRVLAPSGVTFRAAYVDQVCAACSWLRLVQPIGPALHESTPSRPRHPSRNPRR